MKKKVILIPVVVFTILAVVFIIGKQVNSNKMYFEEDFCAINTTRTCYWYDEEKEEFTGETSRIVMELSGSDSAVSEVPLEGKIVVEGYEMEMGSEGDRAPYYWSNFLPDYYYFYALEKGIITNEEDRSVDIETGYEYRVYVAKDDTDAICVKVDGGEETELRLVGYCGNSLEDAMKAKNKIKLGQEDVQDTVTNTSLTETELSFFNEEFFTTETEYPGRWVRNHILYQEFLNPAQVDLEIMLYGECGEDELSEEEIAALKAQGAMVELDIFKFPASYIEELLQNYLGISFEESEKNGLDKFFYYEEEDAYYLVHSDALCCFVQVEEGHWNEDGTITLIYRKAEEPINGLLKEQVKALSRYQVILKQTEQGYQVLSNQIMK